MVADLSSQPDVSDGECIAVEMRPALVRYFRRRSGDAAEAEDLAQDVIARTLDKTLGASAGHVRGYLFRAAANRWKDRLRSDRSRPAVAFWDDESSGLPPEQITPERVLGGEQELAQLTRALLELDDRTRNAFLLVRLENMKVGSVAQMLGISRSAVNRLLAKAIAHIRSKDEGP
jgi:RNA polymerase sigma-70 factor (ECF subfamily)